MPRHDPPDPRVRLHLSARSIASVAKLHWRLVTQCAPFFGGREAAAEAIAEVFMHKERFR